MTLTKADQKRITEIVVEAVSGTIMPVLDQIMLRLDRLEARMDRLEARMDRLEARMDQLEARMNQLEKDVLENRKVIQQLRKEALEEKIGRTELLAKVNKLDKRVRVLEQAAAP